MQNQNFRLYLRGNEQKLIRMESFYRTHTYLVEHTDAPVRRLLMDEIDWSHRLIGIKGTRGVGKTTFLLQYAKEYYGDSRACLYINMNNFYFARHTLLEFAQKFVDRGGRVLLIDQVFKHPNWSEVLLECYENLPTLQIVFTGSSVMRLKQENPQLGGIVKSYNLRGFSFREYLNLKTGKNLPPLTLSDILERHEEIAREYCVITNPLNHLQDYIHHGFYPFHLEKRNFSENLLKVMNMMIEVDILLIKQIELKYLPKIKQLFYLLGTSPTNATNVSQLASEIQTSRATVMNYLKYLTDARLINMVYKVGEVFPKKPSKVLLHNSNMNYVLYPRRNDEQEIIETFFMNSMMKDHKVNLGDRYSTFIVDSELPFKLSTAPEKRKKRDDVTYVESNRLVGKGNEIPLWLFGFLY